MEMPLRLLYAIKATGECRKPDCPEANKKYTVSTVLSFGTQNEVVQNVMVLQADEEFRRREWPCRHCGQTLRILAKPEFMFAATGQELWKNGYLPEE
jgi:hypothetical protein